jgi:DMSO/TMAO reductase YedYZ molybdopterin-dependent catalytic subunit
LQTVLPALLLAGCAGRQAEGSGSEKAGTVGRAVGAGGNPPTSLYLQLVDGLHVTGTPVEVDIETFRLRVSGAVERPLSLSFEQIRALPAVREEITLNCPGSSTTAGGPVLVRDPGHGRRAGASSVSFISLSGYSSTLSLEDLQKDGVLIAYEFEGKPFPWCTVSAAPDGYDHQAATGEVAGGNPGQRVAGPAASSRRSTRQWARARTTSRGRCLPRERSKSMPALAGNSSSPTQSRQPAGMRGRAVKP